MSKTLCGRPTPKPHATQKAEIEAQRQKLARYLSGRGLRFTEPRWKVAQAILNAGRHLEAPAILEQVHKRNPDVGAATVYRAITLLCEAGILEQSHQDASGKTLYEITSEDHHDHILCADCGATFEFHDSRLEAAQERIANDQGFSLSDHRHVLMGRCSLLQQQKNSRKPK